MSGRGPDRRIVGVVAVAVLVLLVGASLVIPGRDDSSTDDEPATTTTTIPFEVEPGTVYGYRTLYVPETGVEVAVGETLTFENRDAVDHTFTSDEGLFDSGPVPEGDDYGYAYADAGTYAVHCEIHPTMRAEVVVTPE